MSRRQEAVSRRQEAGTLLIAMARRRSIWNRLRVGLDRGINGVRGGPVARPRTGSLRRPLGRGGFENLVGYVEVGVYVLNVVVVLEQLDEPDRLLRLLALD